MNRWSQNATMWLIPILLLALAALAPEGGRVTSEAEAAPPAASAKSAARLEALVAVMQSVEDDAVRKDVLAGMLTALRGRRGLGVPEGWPALYADLRKSRDATVRESAMLIALVFGDTAATTSLRKLVGDAEGDAAERVRALRALAEANDDELRPILQAIVARKDADPTVLAAAIRNLARDDDPDLPERLLGRYDALGAARRDVVATLTSRPAWSLALLRAVEEGRVPRGDVSAFDARQMASFKNEQVDRRLAEVWGLVRRTAKERTATLDRYKRELTPEVLAEANPVAGRQVFAKTCAGCHRLFEAGRRVGPDLTGSQRSNLDYVLQNLVDPNAIIGRDYRVQVIVTARGRVLNGIIVGETASALELATANETLTLSLEDIESRKASKTSMMPEGMLAKLSPEQRRDLVAYLASPRQVPLPKRSE